MDWTPRELVSLLLVTYVLGTVVAVIFIVILPHVSAWILILLTIVVAFDASMQKYKGGG